MAYNLKYTEKIILCEISLFRSKLKPPIVGAAPAITRAGVA